METTCTKCGQKIKNVIKRKSTRGRIIRRPKILKIFSKTNDEHKIVSDHLFYPREFDGDYDNHIPFPRRI